MSEKARGIVVRGTETRDFDGIIEVCRAVYPTSPAWTHAMLASHLDVFPDGQIVAVDERTGRVVGMAASLIVLWEDYDLRDSWRDFTDHGMFTNHDPVNGRTLYGAEVMVHPDRHGRGIGGKLYARRRRIAREFGLLRIRAGARLRGFHRYADRMSAEEYAVKVARGELWDPTVSFQLRHGFRILAVVSDYLKHDPESLGHAALIEWLNPDRATPEDAARQDSRFRPRD